MSTEGKTKWNRRCYEQFSTDVLLRLVDFDHLKFVVIKRL